MEQHKNTTATVRAVLAAAQDRGVDTFQLLSSAGIDTETAFDPDGEVTLPMMRQFWETAYDMSGDPYLALNAGIKAAHGSYKTLDYLLFASTRLGEGMRSFIEHFRLINTWLNYVVEEDADRVRLTLRSEIGPVPPPAVEVTFSVITERCRKMLGAGWAPEAISFLHTPRGEASYYQGFFRCPVAFDAEVSSMSFSREQWDAEIPSGDAGLFRVLEAHATHLKASRPKLDDMVGRALAEILKNLKHGVPSVEEIAERLGVSVRTLQRRLSDQDVSYSQLVDELRETQARELVGAGNTTLGEIAFFLGFAEQSAFSRAFKRWTGQTPREFRK